MLCVGETVSDVSPAPCVILIFCDTPLFALILTIAVRSLRLGFSVAETVTVAMPVVDELGLTVNHVKSGLAVHVIFDKTSIVAVLPAVLSTLADVAETVNTVSPAA